jgi:retinol dehydrogenase-12
MNYQNNYNPGMAYGRSKAANILFTRELQKKIDEAGLNGATLSLHPGVVRTELARYMSWKLRLMTYVLSPLLFVVMKSPFEGAQTTLYTVLQQK